MNGTATFRTCAQTGLRVHGAAERLIRVHAVAGVLAILFGGIVTLIGLGMAAAGEPPLPRWLRRRRLPADTLTKVFAAGERIDQI